MKLLTIKKRYINSVAKGMQDHNEGLKKGLKFWKESLKSMKRCYWRSGKMQTSPSELLNFSHSIYLMNSDI
tara:strand:- start:243 stop:455 length:213 start_codon:yes stop_codon:yes gene_type:complete